MAKVLISLLVLAVALAPVSGNGCAAGKYMDEASAPCKSCPDGKSTAAGAGTNYAACGNCAAGKFASNGSPCTNCDVGKFSAEASTFCTSCPAGKSTGGAGGESKAEECVYCVAGKFAPMGSPCTQCRPGTFSVVASDACTNCPFGKSTAAGAGTNEAACVNCAAGKFAPEGAACGACGDGQWSDVASSGCRKITAAEQAEKDKAPKSCFDNGWASDASGVSKCGAGWEPYGSTEASNTTRMGDSAEKCCKSKGTPTSPSPSKGTPTSPSPSQSGGTGGAAFCDAATTKWNGKHCVASYEGVVAACKAARGTEWGWTCSSPEACAAGTTGSDSASASDSTTSTTTNSDSSSASASDSNDGSYDSYASSNDAEGSYASSSGN